MHDRLAIPDKPKEGALMEMSGTVMEMASQLEEMKQKLQLVKQFFQQVMEKDVDYGTIPGTDKPALYQPGADKINALYNFSKVIASKEENKDYGTGHYDATIKVQLVHRGSGTLISEGEGSCSTRENKYHYRWVGEKDVPRGIDRNTLQKKDFENRNTGAKWSKYRIENEDLFSLWNTVLKMAVKRAYIAATLSGTGLSGLFSQEEDSLEAWIEGDAPEEPSNGTPPPRKPGKPSGITINFGKYKGQTLEEIHADDPTYLEWLVKNAKDERVRVAANKLLTDSPRPERPASNGRPERAADDDTNPLVDDDMWAALEMEDDEI